MDPVTFPNGQTLATTAMDLGVFQTLMQRTTATVFAADVSTNRAVGWAQFRVDWPPAGQPGFLQTEDVCFIRCTMSEEPWGDIFETSGHWDPAGYGEGGYGGATPYGELDNSQVTERLDSQRVWNVRWEFWGPNSFDRARLLRTALFLEWVGDTLAQSNLSLVTEVNRPVRLPELFEGHWWERCDLTARFNEGVTDTLTMPAGKSVEVIVNTAAATLADLTILQPATGD